MISSLLRLGFNPSQLAKFLKKEFSKQARRSNNRTLNSELIFLMKAILCKSYGPPSNLVLEDIPSLSPKKGEVVVAVKSCALNFPDTLIIQGLYQFKPPLPFSPGSDIAGVVKEVGEGVTHLKVGDEVLGLVPHGGFAEEVLAPADWVFPKPEGMSFVNAAAFMMAYGTSYHALKDRANMQKGETLLVLGASGGIGLTAVELGKLMGANVIAAASTEEKLQLCREYGADMTINYREEDLKQRIRDLTDGKGADVIIDPVGGHYTEAALRSTARGGRLLVIGFTAGEIPKIPLNLPLLKSCSIVGVFWGDFVRKNPEANRANAKQLLQWYFTQKIRPHIHATYPLEEVPKALEEMMDRKVRGKVVIEV